MRSNHQRQQLSSPTQQHERVNRPPRRKLLSRRLRLEKPHQPRPSPRPSPFQLPLPKARELKLRPPTLHQQAELLKTTPASTRLSTMVIFGNNFSSI